MIDLERKENIALVKVNNPPMNVLCRELLEDLDEALDDIEGDDDILAAVITGEGKAFVAGADIDEMKDMDEEEAEEFSRLGQEVLSRIEDLPIPVIAAVNGFALGGGTELALACDIRIASEAAKFGQPEVNLGVIPGFGGTQRLPRYVNNGMAKKIIFTGDMIDADTAHSIGLVQKVVDGYEKDEEGELLEDENGKPIKDDEPVMNSATELAETIASKGPVAIANAKKAINQGLNRTIEEGLKLEAKNFAELFSTKDQKEGMEAFLEKREPDFRGE